MTRQPHPPTGDGFTRIELLVVVVVVLLLLVFAPAYSGPRGDSTRVASCMYNQKVLMLAWLMYTSDHQDVLPYAFGAKPGTSPGCWSGPGGMPWDMELTMRTQQGNWDWTNTIAKSPLWRYAGATPAAWRCPADHSTGTTPSGRSVPRPRSYSMDGWVGGNGDNPPGYTDWSRETNWLVYRRISDMTNPGPAKTWVLIDESDETINDGLFALQMTGYTGAPNGTEEIIDLPSARHHGAGVVGFADGHVERHQWRDQYVLKGQIPGIVPSPRSPDVFWLQDHATRHP